MKITPEMLKKIAEAVGKKSVEVKGAIVFSRELIDVYRDFSGKQFDEYSSEIYYPLDNDIQAMELAKHFKIGFWWGRNAGASRHFWCVSIPGDGLSCDIKSENLNEAIVQAAWECIK